MGVSGAGIFPAAAMACGAAAATATTTSSSEEVAKRVRKLYTITKSRESWTEPEHDKFLEALHLFDRDWKKIEAFIGSKTAIQIRSHAQKYFLKVQKNGINEHLPPPRPKRKADHPYPRKASKNAPVCSPAIGPFQSSSSLLEAGNVVASNGSSILRNPVASTAASLLTNKPAPTANLSHVSKADLKLDPIVANNCHSSIGDTTDKVNHVHPSVVLPDFGQVYSFIGSVFDPDGTGHLQKLKQMDPINVQTVVVLMRNLSINLASPDFEDHKMLLSSCDVSSDGIINGGHLLDGGTPFGGAI